MELELQRACLEGSQMCLERSVAVEETLEGIVPDTRPDIMRIVDAAGQVFLTARELAMGSLRLTGKIAATVLYIPDGEEGPRPMEVSIPFLCSVDDPALHSGCKVWASPRLCSVDARALNPRKILARAEVIVDLRVYAPDEQAIAVGVTGAKGELQQRLEERETWVVSAMGEKDFTFSDVLDLPSSRPRAVELLRCRLEPRAAEARVIGGKLIFKGESELAVLYRTESGAAASARFSIPCSQVMEMPGVGEENEVQAEAVLTALDCSLQPGDPGSVAVTMEMRVQAAVQEKRKVSVLTDLYATDRPLEAERGALILHSVAGEERRRESARQFCECGIPPETVVDAFLSVGRVTTRQEGGTLEARAETEVTVLFLSEDGALCSVTYPIPVTMEKPAAEGCDAQCRCAGAGELTAVPVTGGLEVRFEVEFTIRELRRETCPLVEGVRALPMPEGGGERPAVILRAVCEGETLWDIAKAYQSTVGDIVAANELEGERADCGTMLLIPRRR